MDISVYFIRKPEKESCRSILIVGIGVGHPSLCSILRDSTGTSKRAEAVSFNPRGFHLDVRHTDAK